MRLSHRLSSITWPIPSPIAQIIRISMENVYSHQHYGGSMHTNAPTADIDATTTINTADGQCDEGSE